MNIRRLKDTDAIQLKNLSREFWIYNRIKLLKGEILEIEEINNWEAKLDDEFHEYIKNICFVAVEKNKILGFITGEVINREFRTLKKRGRIGEFFVTEKERSKGLGKKLFGVLINELKKEGCAFLTVDAYVENKEVIGYYKRQGFAEWYKTFVKKI